MRQKVYLIRDNTGMLGRKGEYKDATRDYDQAIDIDKNYVDAYYQRSLARFARQKYEDAIKDCDKPEA